MIDETNQEGYRGNVTIPAAMQFMPFCVRCGAQGVTEHKQKCPNFISPLAGKEELK